MGVFNCTSDWIALNLEINTSCRGLVFGPRIFPSVVLSFSASANAPIPIFSLLLPNTLPICPLSIPCALELMAAATTSCCTDLELAEKLFRLALKFFAATKSGSLPQSASDFALLSITKLLADGKNSVVGKLYA